MHFRGLLCLSLILSAGAWSQTKPNFSGTWKLNPAESDFSDKRAAVPDALVWKIQQRGDDLKYSVEAQRQGKKNDFKAELRIGGQPFESDAAGIISAKWDSDSLAVDTLYNPDNDRRSSMEEVWTLSSDGKKLTDKVVYHVPKIAKNPADVQFQRVFDKQ